MPKKIQGREIPPHDFCWCCGKGDSTRVIFVTGDVEWLTAAFMALLQHDEDKARDLAQHMHEIRAEDVDPADRLPVPVQLCRYCAERGVQRLVDSGQPRAPIYSHAKWRKGEYEDGVTGGVFQPIPVEAFDAAADYIASMTCTEELYSAHADEGATFRRWWDEDEQQWGVFYAAYPLAEDEQEIQIGEQVFPDGPPESR